MKIYKLEIENFKGIQKLEATFGGAKTVCLIGRGDSCKSTILKAIELGLSPKYKEEFIDSDFYNGDIQQNIKIKITIGELDDYFFSDDKYGLYVRFWDSENKKVIDTIDDIERQRLLTICLEVDKNLEPKWSLITERNTEEKTIYHKERAAFKVSYLDDYTDKHFLWSKSSPLYTLLTQEEGGDLSSTGLIDILRKIKDTIKINEQEQLATIASKIKTKIIELSGNVKDLKTDIDLKDIMLKDTKFSLHDETVPLKNKGKGTKKLISLSIQMLLLENNGVSLIDEIEQGLEPDRVRHLVRKIKELLASSGQVFMTTHSRDTVTELDAHDLYIIKNINGQVSINNIDNSYQDIVRRCPEFFFNKKIIVCEGKTEEGICRANIAPFDSFPYYGVIPINGGGAPDCFKTANTMHELGYQVAIFCDSDREQVDSKLKQDLKSLGVSIFDCDPGNSIEQQIFLDMPWDSVLSLVNLAITQEDKAKKGSIISLINSKYSGITEQPISTWTDSIELRKAIGDSSKSGEWFKNITKGMLLGEMIIKDLPSEKKISSIIKDIENWAKQDDYSTTNT